MYSTDDSSDFYPEILVLGEKLQIHAVTAAIFIFCATLMKNSSCDLTNVHENLEWKPHPHAYVHTSQTPKLPWLIATHMYALRTTSFHFIVIGSSSRTSISVARDFGAVQQDRVIMFI